MSNRNYYTKRRYMILSMGLGLGRSFESHDVEVKHIISRRFLERSLVLQTQESLLLFAGIYHREFAKENTHISS